MINLPRQERRGMTVEKRRFFCDIHGDLIGHDDPVCLQEFSVWQGGGGEEVLPKS